VLPEGPSTILDVPDNAVITAIQQSWTLVKKQADVMIVMDVSGSMQDNNKIGEAKEAAQVFLNGMQPGNRVGLTIFSNDVDVRVPLGNLESVRNQISSNIQGLRADGGTELYQALAEVTNLLNTETDAERVRAVILLSDGADTGDSGVSLNDVLRSVSASRDSLNPVIVVPLAYGADADVQTLNSIAQASRTRLQSGDVENISALLDLLSSFF
jgi:Ca-activated chloride channel family protein